MRRAAAAALVVATGCSVPIAHWSAATPPGVGPAAATAAVKRSVTGRSCRWFVLGIPFGLPRIEEAMADALAQGHGTAMRSFTLYSEHPFYGPVGRNCYAVKGDVVG